MCEANAYLSKESPSATYNSSGLWGRLDRDEDKEKEPVAWRDTEIRIGGPVVAKVQQLLMDTWQYQEDPPLNYFPKLKEVRKEGGAHPWQDPRFPRELHLCYGHFGYQERRKLCSFDKCLFLTGQSAAEGTRKCSITRRRRGTHPPGHH